MSIQERTLALAGIFQTAELVRQVARKGMVEQTPFESSINSILVLDADHTEKVYGELSNVKLGLKTLRLQFERSLERKHDLELMRYISGILLLERKLHKKKKMLQALREQLDSVSKLLEDYPVTHPKVIAELATTYTNTIGTFDFRIQVMGEPHFLKNDSNAERIRALLLAGIRSAVLWRQKKGARLQFIFARKKIVATAEQFLAHIQAAEQISHTTY